MKDNQKKYLIYGLAALALMGGSGGLGYYLGGQAEQEKAAEYGIEYAHDHAHEHDHSHDHDHDHEHSDAEHIVVKITDDGYVTSHGDHFHYLNGQVPFDSIFSEELLMKDPDYVLKEEHIQYDIEGGHIIKVDGQYYVYLKDPKKAKNIRTAEEIKEQQQIKGLHDHDHDDHDHHDHHGGSGSRNSAGQYTTSDGYVFSPSDVIEDLGDGYIVPHGDHFHFIPKADLTSSEIAQAKRTLAGGSRGQGPKQTQQIASGRKRTGNAAQKPYTTSDGYVFKATDIIKDTGTGYIVPHGSHFHYIPKADLSPSEQQAARRFLAGQTNGGAKPKPQRPQTSKKQKQKTEQTKKEPQKQPEKKPQKPESQTPQTSQDYKKMPLNDLLALLYKQPAAKRYQESDGLVFDPAAVTEKNEFGYVIPHGDHYHIIPPAKLSELERIAADRFLAEGNVKQEKPESESKPKKEPEAQKPNKTEPNENEKEPEKQEENSDQVFDIKKAKSHAKSAQGKDGKTYTTSDGYTFTPESVIGVGDLGIIAGHGDHTHFIPFADLDNKEIDALAHYLKTNPLRPQQNQNQFTPEEIEQKLNQLAIDLGVNRKDLKVDGDQVIIPHGDHYHTKALADISLEKDLSQFLDEDKKVKPELRADYEAFILNKKLGQIAHHYQVDRHQDIIVSGHLVYVSLPNGEQKKVNLNEWKLDFDHPAVHFEERPAAPQKKEEDKKEAQGQEADKPAESESKEEKQTEEKTEQKNNPWLTLSFAEKKAFVADYYGIASERISEFAGQLLIKGETEDEPNQTINEAAFLAIYPQ